MLTASARLPVSEIWSYPTTSVLPGWHQTAQSAMLNFPTVCYTSNLKQLESTRLEYARHAHVTRKKANISFKHKIPLPMDNLLFRKRVLMERNSSRFVQCHLNAPSGKSSPHTITHHLVQPSYCYQITFLSITQRKIWLCVKCTL